MTTSSPRPAILCVLSSLYLARPLSRCPTPNPGSPRPSRGGLANFPRIWRICDFVAQFPPALPGLAGPGIRASPDQFPHIAASIKAASQHRSFGCPAEGDPFERTPGPSRRPTSRKGLIRLVPQGALKALRGPRLLNFVPSDETPISPTAALIAGIPRTARHGT